MATDTMSTMTNTTLDVEAVRRDFPILSRTMGDNPLVYLDSAATSQKPQCVIEAMNDYYRRYNANVHRGIHTLAEEATEAMERARSRILEFVHADSDTYALVFTRNATEAVNLVAHSWVRDRFGKDDRIVATVMEHHSNMVPWQMAAKACGCELSYIGVTDDGHLNSDDMPRLIDEKASLVAVTGMSNVLGTINDVGTIAQAARAAGAMLLVDGAQLLPHAPVDIRSLGADFLVFSGHKMCGPTGVGALVARRELLEQMPPFMGGGEMIVDVTLEGATWNAIPAKFEAGTPMIAEAIGLGAAVDYLDSLGMQAIRQHEIELTDYALDAFARAGIVRLYGPDSSAERGATFSFDLADTNGGQIHPHDVGTFLSQKGIAIRAGHHCAKPLMRRYGVPAMNRASCYIYTTTDEIDRLVEALQQCRAYFAGTGL